MPAGAGEHVAHPLHRVEVAPVMADHQSKQQIVYRQAGEPDVLRVLLADLDMRLIADLALCQRQALKSQQRLAQQYSRQLQHARRGISRQLLEVDAGAATESL